MLHVSLDSGWREALLSTPVFAAVIRGASYFRAPIVHALRKAHRKRSQADVQQPAFSLVRECQCEWKALDDL